MDRRTFSINIASLIVRAAAVGASIYSAKLMAGQIKDRLGIVRRTEIEPNLAGELVVTEYVHERPVKYRYATRDEVWKYSYERMTNELIRRGYL